MYFNAKDGFLEAILRGYLSELLKTSDYNNLCQCETMDGARSAPLRPSPERRGL